MSNALQSDVVVSELTTRERLVEVAAILAHAVLRVRAAQVRQNTAQAAMPRAHGELPPLHLARRLAESVVDRDDFWPYPAAESPLLRELRQENKHLVVWLELQGRSDAAAKIDTAWVALKEAWWKFDRQRACSGSDDRNDSRCRRPLASLIAAAARLKGVLGDVADEVPESVWKGFPYT
jgi:hypothetical protein